MPLQFVDRTCVLYQGRKLAYFAGCDYYRMSSHPGIMRAVTDGLKKYGLSVAASRVTTGNHALYRELEIALSRFFGAPAAVVVSTGYLTNLAVAQSLRGDFTHVLLDSKAHVSLRDASQLFDCPVLEFKTRDLADLRRVHDKLGAGAKLILLTDGVFTYEGEVAPLNEYLKILGRHGTILVDDAHSAGLIGERGRGSLEYCRVSRSQIIQTLTLSKAFGAFGGAILCSRELRERIVGESSIFAGSTPLPLPLVCAGIRAIEILKSDNSFGERINKNAHYVKSKLQFAGFPVSQSEVPVAAVTPKSSQEARLIEKRLLAHGVFPSFIRYPGGPPGGYLRIVISSEHAKAEMDRLLAALSGFR